MGETALGNRKTNCAVFNELFAVLTRKGGRKRFDTMFLVQNLMNNRIVTTEKTNFIWNSKRGTDMEVLGNSREQVIALLLDVEKAHIKQMLTNESSETNLI